MGEFSEEISGTGFPGKSQGERERGGIGIKEFSKKFLGINRRKKIHK